MGSITGITRRRKIGDFQRLTSILNDESQPWRLKGKMVSLNTQWLCEKWHWRRLLLRAEEQTLLKAQGYCFVAWTVFLVYFNPTLCALSCPGHSFLNQLRRMILAIAISLQSISDWVMEREKMKCRFEVKLPLKRRKTYLLKFFRLYPVFCSTAVWCLAMSLIAIVLRLIRLWIVVCMLIRIFFLALKWTKLLPLSIFYVEKRHTVLFVPSSPLSQALFSACEGLLQISCVVCAALLSEA